MAQQNLEVSMSRNPLLVQTSQLCLGLSFHVQHRTPFDLTLLFSSLMGFEPSRVSKIVLVDYSELSRYDQKEPSCERAQQMGQLRSLTSAKTEALNNRLESFLGYLGAV